MRKGYIVFIMLIFMMTVTQENHCQVPYLSLNGGFSQDLRMHTDNMWKMGFSWGANVFLNKGAKMAYGLHFSCNRWSIDGKNWIYVFVGDFEFDKASGRQSIVEIIPSLRYRLLGKNPAVNLYAQGGIGLFLVNVSEVKVRGTYQYGWSVITFDAKNSANIGIQIGPCLILGKRIELLPLYSLYLLEGELYNHISVQLGIRIL